MQLMYDTSVLVAGMVSAHPQYHVALPWLQRVQNKQIELFISAHSLAECFAVLTTLPFSPKISPDTANLLIRENVEKLAHIVTLSAQDYKLIIKNMTELGFSGGIIYDAITASAAKKANVEKILTLNRRDFIRLFPDRQDFILSP